MVFIILPLATDNSTTTTAPSSNYLQQSKFLSADGDIDISDDDSDHRSNSKLAKLSSVIVTPGETVTEDPQWMRHVKNLLLLLLINILCICIFINTFLPKIILLFFSFLFDLI